MAPTGLFDVPTLLAYLAAAALLVVMPGPGTAWILAQSLAGGTVRGLRAALGLETATLLHALAAGLGLSAILATSALAFEIVKYAGAAYLVWLGIRAWRSPAPGARPAPAPPDAAPAPVTRDGVYLRSVLTGLLNPKVALFFLAFLPQFVHPGRGWVWLQFLVLGALLALIGFSHSLVLSLAAGRLGRGVRSRGSRWMQRAFGGLMVGLGIRLAMQARA